MILLFPAQPHEKNAVVDDFFMEEYQAAKKAGFKTHYINEGRIKDAPMFCGLRVPKFDNITECLYRGYIIRNSSNFYSGFYNALEKYNKVSLINTPYQYKNAQLLCESYSHFEKWSIPTVFVEKPTEKILKLASKQLQSIELFVKDYVKSEYNLNKIDVRDLKSAMQMLKTLEQERGDMFEGGFAFRPFVNLSSIEYRLWVYKGRILNEQWGDLPSDIPLLLYKKIESFNSDFYTIDLGRYKESGKLVVIETNDGQVSGLKGLDPNIFYNTLKAHL